MGGLRLVPDLVLPTSTSNVCRALAHELAVYARMAAPESTDVDAALRALVKAADNASPLPAAAPQHPLRPTAPGPSVSAAGPRPGPAKALRGADRPSPDTRSMQQRLADLERPKASGETK